MILVGMDQRCCSRGIDSNGSFAQISINQINQDVSHLPELQPSLRELFDAHDGRLIDKWAHYFEVYDRHFSRFRGQPCTVVEIGVFHGGSLQLWRKYFGPQARIIGVDRSPRTRQLADDGIEIVIGDQADRAFLQELARQVGPIDVLIDDGGHRMGQQINTFAELFDTVTTEGVLLVEDTHTSYWRKFGGGLCNPNTFMEFSKRKIDELNAWHSRDTESLVPTAFTRTARSMHFYDSIVVVEKGPHPRPKVLRQGTPVFELPAGWEAFGEHGGAVVPPSPATAKSAQPDGAHVSAASDAEADKEEKTKPAE